MKKILIQIALLLSLVSCGDLFTKATDSGEVALSQLGSCELNMDAFSYILEKNIKGDIKCLEEKLNVFMDFVRTERPGYMSKAALKDFLLNGPMDVDPDIADIVDSVFDLSFLIRGTEKEFIKRADVGVLLDFLVKFNEHIWKSNQLFKSEDKVNYYRHLSERSTIFNEFAIIAEELEAIYIPNRSQLDRIDTQQFIYNFFQGDISNLEKLRSLMFLKRVFLGGDIWDLTHIEFKDSLSTLPYLAQAAFDIVKMDRYEFADKQSSLIKIFMKDIEIVKRLMFFDGSSHEPVFSITSATNAIKIAAPDLLPVDITDYENEIRKLKDVLVGSDSDDVSARELIAFLDLGMDVFQEGDLFYRAYEMYADELNSKEPITHSFEDFPVRNSLEQEFLDNFATIAQNYKFIKGSFTSPFFTYEFNRNANAFFQIGVLEYFVKKVMGHYGNANPNARGGFDMSLDQTVGVIDDFKWFLKDQGIITIGRTGGGEVAGVADNLVLMSTLFQYQSDGCGDLSCMEVPEITEFLIGLLTALEVKDYFTDTMMELCKDHLDQFDRIAPACFRNNFVKVLENPIPEDGRSISDYMPYLYQYVNELTKDVPAGSPITDSEGYMTFITETESFTRTCTYYDEEETDEVYLRVNDAFAVFAGLLNVESTLIRFDQDQNNIIDSTNSRKKNEVMTAYSEVYKGALIALAEQKLGNATLAKVLAKPIFKYLVKYGDVPDTSNFGSIWKFVKFILKRNKSADISRTTVATILKIISEQSENADLHPFKCEECLRDPNIECLPEGEPWDPR
mgnify:CR=1 FL=1